MFFLRPYQTHYVYKIAARSLKVYAKYWLNPSLEAPFMNGNLGQFIVNAVKSNLPITTIIQKTSLLPGKETFEAVFYGSKADEFTINLVKEKLENVASQNGLNGGVEFYPDEY